MAETVDQRLDRHEHEIRNIAANVLNLTEQLNYRIRRLEGDLADERASTRPLVDGLARAIQQAKGEQ